MLHGVLLIALFSCAAFYIGEMSFVRSISFSPMIVGIILGMLYANSLRNHLPETWVLGIQFCSKKILRIGIILYGFRLTFQDVMAIGLPAMLIDVIIVAVTICGGIYLGKLLKMDRGIALLTSIGSGICGAAAILGAESTIKAKPYKTAVSVSTVVIFGTISMFLYPFLYRNGFCALTPDQMGIYTGATLHEVAHVVGAWRRDGKRYFGFCHHSENDSCDDVGYVLLITTYLVARARKRQVQKGQKFQKIAVPWFAIGFMGVIAFNSFDLLPAQLVAGINTLDTFLLTMAMTALGTETSIDKFRKAGAKPFVLALLLYVWLVVGGYFLVKYLTPYLM
ncbi:YeiH family protein [Bacteroides thetaiotaomicron]|nr:YeiH family protein [Bacteroides thetaiotaomicron]